MKSSYNTRHSGRYNVPGQFVPAAETQNYQQHQSNQQQQQPLYPSPQNTQRKSFNQNIQIVQTDVEMKVEPPSTPAPNTEEAAPRPNWMKPKLPGVKKISNKERRRRQNENLRKLLTPKNALMVLNEMMPNEQLTNQQFKVEPASQFPGGGQYFGRTQHNFCADLSLDGNNYKGYGENKLTARNAAAEQAIRDLILKKMAKVLQSDSASSAGGSQNGDEPMLGDDEALPMIQLASFALHKLFSEWEFEGHKVPQLKPSHASMSESNAGDSSDAFGRRTDGEASKPKPAKKPKELPLNASTMHPCMLLTYMRPQLTYRTMNIDGDRPQNVMYTLGVDVDGTTYVGKAANKKEARKQAAMAACQALFNIKFDENASANTPVLVKA